MSDEHDLARYACTCDEDADGDPVAVMAPSDDGQWMRYEDVKNEMAYLDGYLMEHVHLLQSLGAHHKIVSAVEALRERIQKV